MPPPYRCFDALERLGVETCARRKICAGRCPTTARPPRARDGAPRARAISGCRRASSSERRAPNTFPCRAQRSEHGFGEGRRAQARRVGASTARKLGVQSRRQVPIDGRYIVDFAAPAARLVVEVDGGHHAGRRAGDRRRDERLRELGWRVGRVEVSVVMRELGAAVGAVRAAL
jgi:very-short-patch-repair endonuclease